MIYSNIFYFKVICRIGGTEQFLYEIAKKYNDYDITIFYDQADTEQLRRLRQYVRCIKRQPGKMIQCKKAFFNFNIDMIDDIEAEEYYFVSHAIYQELGYKPPIENQKLTHYIGVSEYSSNKLIEYANKLGKEIEPITCYNPITLESKQKVIRLVSACRLDDKTKGGNRTLKLIEALDRYCKQHNRNYIFTIFTNTFLLNINSPNVAIMKPRIDVRPYIADADYLVQLSNDMETYCYTVNEALGYGVPVITTPLTILKELPITDNEHITLEWDCSNIDEVVEKIFNKKVKPFEYISPKDNWIRLLAKVKSNYKSDINKKVYVKCKVNYYDDLMLGRRVKENELIKVDLIRAEELIRANVCEYIKDGDVIKR